MQLNTFNIITLIDTIVDAKSCPEAELEKVTWMVKC